MAGELELDGGGEDPDLAARGVVHEDGLAQAEVGGHALTGLGGHVLAVQKYRERVAARAVVAAEHAQEMET